MTDRALSPVVGTLVLVGLVLVAATVVAAASGSVASEFSPRDTASLPSAADPVAFSLAVTGNQIAVTHERGPPIQVADLRIHILVAGDSLAFQPPVPFFSARGFRPGPTGPFNVGSDGVWSAGETGSVVIAGTNDPQPEPGGTVTVQIYRIGSSRPLATLTASAGRD
ncbi:type IV pilin [Halogeometricum borinquense]|uniref:Type IV pilin n=1 Tax=Halogeometricum borinquense TaxID=60847 RepID=A0A6C0UJ96_9EURY|nr:type IV pilin [Halogeometricum borinquense]QIB73028.1 type IV pilin [Halogeometricum borinquense]QIQ77574.1 type IV pilin [Halogeometricum borinquense]